jgi:hypothetical protein
VFHVRCHDGGSLLKSLSGDEHVTVQSFGRCRNDPRRARGCPERSRSPPSGGGDGLVDKLARKLVEVSHASRGANSKELTPKLVVGDLRDEKRVLLNGLAKPSANLGVFSRMADLPKDPGVEEQLHESDDERSESGSRSLTSQSGSSEASSAAQRSSIVATRCARSICGRTRARISAEDAAGFERRGDTRGA